LSSCTVNKVAASEKDCVCLTAAAMQ